MAAGDPAFDLIQLEDDAGTAQSYANLAAFNAAGWAISFEDKDGAALSPQPTITVADEGSGLHRINLTEPATECYGKITVPAGYYTPKLALYFEAAPYDAADLMAAILSANGSTAGTGAARVTDTLENWVEGDSFRLDVAFTAAQVAKIGKANLTGVTVRAAMKRAFPDADSGDTEAFTLTWTLTDATAMTGVITKDTFPTPTADLADGVESVPYVLDITIENDADGRVYTALRYEVSIVWEADTRN
jgi:hypothetical protein